MNEKTARVIGLSIVALIIILWASYVLASTVVLPPADSFIDQADVVARGKVASITSYNTDNGLRTLIEIDVNEPIKGVIGNRIQVREIGGKVGNDILWISGSPEYKVGEKVTVLLKRQPDGSLRTHLLDNGRIPVQPAGTANALFGRPLSFKEVVDIKIDARKKELKSVPQPLALGLMVQPAPLSGPAESLTEFRFMTDPPSRWLNNPVAVYGDPVGDVKYGPVESQRSVKDATESWSSAGNVTFQYTGDTPAVGYTCVPDKLLVQFRDVKNDIEDPNQCSGVLAIGGFCGGAIINGKYKITGGAVVFNNGWEGCSFWNPDNITEVMTHEFGHAIGLSHSAESGQPTTQYTQDATMFWMAHFDGRRNGIKEYDRGAIAALYGAATTPVPTASPSPTAVPTATPIPTPSFTPMPTATPTPIPSPTTTATSPFYEVSSLLMSVNNGAASIKLVVDSEPVEKAKPQLILYSNDTKKAVLLSSVSNVQFVKNQLTFRASTVPTGFITKNTSVAVITGSRIALVDLICSRKPNTNIYNCQ